MMTMMMMIIIAVVDNNDHCLCWRWNCEVQCCVCRERWRTRTLSPLKDQHHYVCVQSARSVPASSATTGGKCVAVVCPSQDVFSVYTLDVKSVLWSYCVWRGVFHCILKYEWLSENKCEQCTCKKKKKWRHTLWSWFSRSNMISLFHLLHWCLITYSVLLEIESIGQSWYQIKDMHKSSLSVSHEFHMYVH